MQSSTHASFAQRIKGIGLVALMAGAFVAVGGGIGQAASKDAEADIEKLTYCYARGTDAIGRGDLAEGKSIYTGCFTNDAEVSVYFPGTDVNGPPDFTAIGTDAWGDFVAATFTTNGYTATQHQMGNVEVDVNGPHAAMSSYLHATHVVANGTIDVANGTYVDEVVRHNGKWKIKRRVLKLITFLNLGTPTL
ncbi:Hypothetical protein A7982_00863 [Minicystis rosea]|nr:Hypothetical protein A7982_00863 [Minicystis rosea]